MRLVNIKERMPREEDADSECEVVWIAISKTSVRGEIEEYHHSLTETFAEHGLERFKRQILYDPSDDEIFWLEVNPQPALPEVKSHIRKVEL